MARWSAFDQVISDVGPFAARARTADKEAGGLPSAASGPADFVWNKKKKKLAESCSAECAFNCAGHGGCAGFEVDSKWGTCFYWCGDDPVPPTDEGPPDPPPIDGPG